MQLPVSIIIPTLNEEKYLPRLLTSIRNQSRQPTEIIVADAHSEDKTREIAMSFHCKIVPGGKLTFARNSGAKHAKAPILLFLDSDSVLPPKFLEKAIPEFIERGLSISSCYLTPDTNTFVDRLGTFLANGYYKLTESVRAHGNGCCLLATKEIHDKISGFDEEVVLAEDQDYVLRAAKVGKYGFLRSTPVITSTRRFNEDGKIMTSFKYIYMEIYILLYGKMTKSPFSFSWGKHKKTP